MKSFIHSCIALLIAIILTGLGVALFIHANLGSDTITVFIDGLRTTFNLSLGNASRVYNIIALVLAIILSRKDIGWTSIVYALSTGFFMDYFDELLLMFSIMKSGMIIRLLVVLVGQLCIIVSFTLLIRFGSGMDQLDAIAYGIERKIRFKYAYIRTALDVFMITTGFVMGGVIGIGSIIAMATTGIGIDFLLNTRLLKENKNRRTI